MKISLKTVLSACLVTALALGLGSNAQAGYETNKFDLKANVEAGGWIVGWSDDITETDALKGVVAAAVSVYAGNPAPFNAWCDNLVDRTFSSLGNSVKSRFSTALRTQMKTAVRDVFRAVVQGKNPKEILRRYDTVDFKAGGIRYSGRNYVTIFGSKKTISTTWGLKLYVAYRIR